MKNRIHYAGLQYTNSRNIGDYIQSLAVEQFLPRISKRFERDDLRNIKNTGKTYVLVANGWFSHTPEQCFPFAPCIMPLFFGFHLTNWNHTCKYVQNKHVSDFLRKYSPIGCRDRFTENKLKELEIETFFSNCMTLSFPNRDYTPPKTKFLMVDIPNLNIPDYISRKSVFITHVFSEIYPEREKFASAKALLDYYRKKVSAVVTTRLHCALPCLAMGIPVIFIGNKNEPRFNSLTEVRVKIYHPAELSDHSNWDELFYSDFDFIESVKSKMIGCFKEQLLRIQSKIT